ncbi:penicillin-binding protein 2 [Candidatus Saccharibacteria bacterium]|nr:penicillin-binding protein 2 [Candidatus Saccharibacteria bacterium]
MRNQPVAISHHFTALSRIRLWYVCLLVVAGVFVVRLFYLQVIRHDYYQTAALTKQLKEYEVPASRGIIEATSNGKTVPIVLNESKYTLFADPIYVKDPKAAADAVARIIGGDANSYEAQLKTDNTRYVVLAKKLDKDKAEALDKLELKGIGTREASYRTYPQGQLAAQLLGFVNDEGSGKYGLEEALDAQLKGAPGQLKAITDAQGVPLASNKENIVIEPQQGDRVILTVDLGMQQQLEDALKSGLERAQSKTGSALIIEVKTGAVKAVANYPTYNPAEFFKTEDASVFNNAAVSAPLEVGSIMKPLTTAAALDLGVINKETTYYDPGFFQIGDARVTNIEEAGGAATRSVADILQLSLNTGATWLLMQMGGGEINKQARERWYDYMTDHYGFGKPTGIEQGYEAGGSIPDPNEGFGLDIQYANAAFGQGMTATPLQMAAALASAINGGTYFRPRLVEKIIRHDGVEKVVEPEIVRQDVVGARVSDDLRSLLEFAFSKNYMIYGMRNSHPEYSIGTKTGTAQVPKPEGGYYDDRFNGTFLGYIGGDTPQYVIVVRVNEPKIAGYAGSRAAGPIFSSVVENLINNGNVTPKTN